jgi:excisionase family DNA binding protein
MDRVQLTNLLEAVRSVREAVFRMEQELLSALTSEEVRRDAPESHRSNMPDEWFTLAELGDWLKDSRTTAYRLVRDRRIPSYRVGRATRVRRRDVERWMEDEGRSARAMACAATVVRYTGTLEEEAALGRRLYSLVFLGQQDAHGGAVGLGDDPYPLAPRAYPITAEDAETPEDRELVLAGVLGRHFTQVTGLVAGQKLSGVRAGARK